MRVKPADAMLIATFLSMPLIGTPLMLAICLEFLCLALLESKSRMSDVITLVGFLTAYHLALALVLLAWSITYALLWCAIAWPMSYSFCRFALRPKK